MRQELKAFLLLILMGCGWLSHAQKINLGEPENQSIQPKSAHLFYSFKSNGMGIGFQREYHRNLRQSKGWLIEGSFSRQSKERKIHSSYGDAKRGFVYGKLNHVCHLKADYGLTHMLNDKPYWGGISTAYYFYGGGCLGVTWPVYIRSWYKDENNRFQVVSEAYDPQKHSLSNIYDGDGFFKGMGSMKLHPGIHLQGGLLFDFSNKERIILAMSVGVNGELYALPIEYMAGQDPTYYLLNLYINLHFGKRFSH